MPARAASDMIVASRFTGVCLAGSQAASSPIDRQFPASDRCVYHALHAFAPYLRPRTQCIFALTSKRARCPHQGNCRDNSLCNKTNTFGILNDLQSSRRVETRTPTTPGSHLSNILRCVTDAARHLTDRLPNRKEQGAHVREIAAARPRAI